MAETTAKTTTTPRRRAGATTTRKPAATKAAPKPAAKEEAPAEEPATQKLVVELEYLEDTKSFAKFGVPADLKGVMVGALYVPHGTDRVRVQIVGVDGTIDED